MLDRLLDFNLLKDGTLLVFDDFNCNRANPKMGERRALAESFGRRIGFLIQRSFRTVGTGKCFSFTIRPSGGVAAA